MNLVRTHISGKIFALLMGIVFINTGFFLFELRSLDLNFSKQEMAEIISLVNTVGIEEEKDSAAGGDSFGEQLDDVHLFVLPLYMSELNLLTSTNYIHSSDAAQDNRVVDIVTPPPKTFLLFV